MFVILNQLLLPVPNTTYLEDIAHCKTDLVERLDAPVAWYLINYFTHNDQYSAPLKLLIQRLANCCSDLLYTMPLTTADTANLTQPGWWSVTKSATVLERDAALQAMHPNMAVLIRNLLNHNSNVISATDAATNVEYLRAGLL